MTLADAIGWTATAVFTASYLTRGPSTLRRVQMAGACLWLTYGLVTQAAPVIGSNILVLGAAALGGAPPPARPPDIARRPRTDRGMTRRSGSASRASSRR